VTGVQTCALPISRPGGSVRRLRRAYSPAGAERHEEDPGGHGGLSQGPGHAARSTEKPRPGAAFRLSDPQVEGLTMTKSLGIVAALSGFIAVACGAFGAHGLRAVLSPAMLDTWQTAVSYQFHHSLALLALARSEEHTSEL